MNEIEAVGAEAVSLPLAPGGEGPKERPWIFGLLIAPSAVVANGVLGGVLAYLLSVQGIGSGRQSHLLFLLGVPTWLYFLWSPVTDFFVRRRTWVLIGGLLSAVAMAVSFHQVNLSSTTALSLMFLSACCSQLVVSSCGGMLGALRLERSRRVGGSFYQAGSMGFGALATWALVRLSYSGATRDVLGLTAAAMIGLPTLFALGAPRQDVISEGTFAGTRRRIWMECKTTFGRWEALPYIGCMVFPMASGAAIALLPGVARQYGVDGGNVAWMNGLVGGLLIAAGSASAALLPTRVRASVMYMVVSLVNCAALGVLWLGPMRPSTYYLGVTLYLFTVGTCYSMFTAVLLEFLGQSGKSGSGRYSIINSLGNLPVQYMILIDGWGSDRWGGRGLAGAEAVVGGVGAMILLAYFLTRKRVEPALNGIAV